MIKVRFRVTETIMANTTQNRQIRQLKTVAARIVDRENICAPWRSSRLLYVRCRTLCWCRMYVTCDSHSTAHIPKSRTYYVARLYSPAGLIAQSVTVSCIERLRAQQDPVCGVRAVVCMKSHRNTTCFLYSVVVLFCVCLFRAD